MKRKLALLAIGFILNSTNHFAQMQSPPYGANCPAPIDLYGNPLPFLNNSWLSGPNKLYTLCKQLKVGIATSNPRGSLDVFGAVYASQFRLGMAEGVINPPSSFSSASFYMRAFSQTSGPYSNNAVFAIENNERRLFQIQNDGLVRARELKIDALNNWPDYVFSNDYNLRTLSELELYIKTYGHLPNVPTAAEVSEDGFALGEMNRVLLEKLEELTLYVIEQEKRSKEIEQQLYLLKKQLKQNEE